MRPPRVVSEVRAFLAGHAAGPGVVAVSGGADSVALLRALADAGAGPLTAAHVNHLLRGDESDADEAFVRDLAAALGVGFRSVRIDVAKEAAGDNLEATARRLRYDWLAAVAADAGAAWVATGHTADDQAETVLHRLVRGTGLQGLRGIGATQRPPTAVGGRLLRPLLTVPRTELLDYLAALGQPFRTDSSNADPRFTRNRIRAELLPLLKSFNPAVVSVLGRLAAQAADTFAHLECEAAARLRAAELPRAGGAVVLDADALAAMSPAVVREALRLLWHREGWPAGDMTAAHWDRATEVARGVRRAVEFPSGVTARRVGRVVQVRSSEFRGPSSRLETGDHGSSPSS